MSEPDKTFFVLIALFSGTLLFSCGLLLGSLTVKEPETVYVYERYQPVHPIYSEEIPSGVDSYTIHVEDHEYVFYYWLEYHPKIDQFSPELTLYWGYREVIKP